MPETALHSAPSSPLGCNVFSSMEQVPLSREEWDDFVSQSGGWVYQTWNWTSIWLKHYSSGREVRIFLFLEGNRVVGIVPLVIDTIRIGPVRARVAKPALSDSTMALSDACIAPDRAESVLRMLLEHLFTVERCDMVTTGPSARQDEMFNHWRKCAYSAGCCYRQEQLSFLARFSLPDSFEEYMRSLKKKCRGNVRRDERLLAKSHALRSDVLTDCQDIRACLDEFFSMHELQWMKEGKLGHFNDWPGAKQFARDIIEADCANGRIMMFRLIADEQVVSYQLAYRFGEKLLHWSMPARVVGAQWEGFSLGRIGLVKMIDDAISAGVTLIEGGRGHYDYKVQLGAEEIALQSARIVRQGSRSRCRAFVLERWSKLLNLLYYKVWFGRIAPRLPLPRRGLRQIWIRTRL